MNRRTFLSLLGTLPFFSGRGKKCKTCPKPDEYPAGSPALLFAYDGIRDRGQERFLGSIAPEKLLALRIDGEELWCVMVNGDLIYNEELCRKHGLNMP